MNALPRSAAEPFRILRPLAPLIFLAVASCSSATSLNTSSTQNQTVLQIKGMVLESGTKDVIQSAVVQVRIVTTGSTGAWATDTVSDGNYTVSPVVPGGCTGRDSVSTEWNLQANGFTQPTGTSPKVACTTGEQSLDVYLDVSAARTPQAVAGNLTATRVGAGQEWACAGTADGVYCWGAAAEPTSVGAYTSGVGLPQPTLVPGSAGLSKLSVGNSAVCALDQDGAAWCWGTDIWGELGVPDFTLDYPAQAMAVETDLRFTQVAAGGYATCGLTAGGAAYCWGAGPTLGAGDSLLAASIHPTPARVASDRTFVQVSEGWEHTCALDDGGNAWCWGRNNLDQLGDLQAPAGHYVTTPQEVVGGHHFVSIASGGMHACALTAAGEAWCWGSNHFGQLGDGRDADQGEDSTATPVAVFGGHTFTALFGGIWHTCELTADGSAYCWGRDGTGQLGVGDAQEDVCGGYRCATEPLPVAGGLKFSTLGAGEFLTCGITTAGKLYCWGIDKALGTG